jgi:hypothetical protein
LSLRGGGGGEEEEAKCELWGGKISFYIIWMNLRPERLK